MEEIGLMPKFKHEETRQFIRNCFKKKSETQIFQWLASSPKRTYLRVNTFSTDASSLLAKLREVIPAGICVEVDKYLDDVIVIHDNNKLSDVKRNIENSYDENLAKVVVNSACAASVLRGAPVYAPGIISAPASLSKDEKVLVYADLQLDSKVLKGALKFNHQKKDDFLLIGQGIALLSRSDLFKDNVQCGVGIHMTETIHIGTPVRINDNLLQPLSNMYFMQNLPSILTVHQLEVKPNDKCLDLCAAPGGKTCHIASLLNSSNPVLAFDKSQSKIRQILQNAERLGLEDKVSPKIQDSTKVSDLQAESFDKILLDAPCSALGQRPMLVQTAKVKELKSFAKLQKKLFAKAVSLLKPGGILVYSTCTITLEENEELVKWALSHFTCLKLYPTIPRIGQAGDKNVLNDPEICSKVQRFGPDHDFTIGFFIAKFKKEIGSD